LQVGGPGGDVGPRDVASFDGEQAVTQSGHVEEDLAGAQDVGAGEQQAEHVHGLLVVGLAGAVAAGGDAGELVARVRPVRLGDAAGEERPAGGEEVFAVGGDPFDQG
jgi:hypothetical protein